MIALVEVGFKTKKPKKMKPVCEIAEKAKSRFNRF
jgi:hypothetical protein